MRNDAELERLMGDVESDLVERKESIGDRDRIRQAICAFANDLPGHYADGVIFAGVRDDGSAPGLEIDDRLLLTLSDMRTDGRILPIPSMTVQKRRLRAPMWP
jgi:ATP-dependent DNA helicase RecG